MLQHHVRIVAFVGVLPLLGGCLVKRQHTIRFGPTVHRSEYTDWEVLVRSQTGIGTYSTNSRTTGFGGFLEGRSPNALSYGTEVWYNRRHYDQAYLPGFDVPDLVNGTLDAYYVEPSMKRRWNPNDWVEFQIAGGVVVAMNRLVLKWLDEAGLLTHETRTHTGLNVSYGASAVVGPWNGFGLQVGYKRTDMFRRNGDNSNTLYLGATFDHVRNARRQAR